MKDKEMWMDKLKEKLQDYSEPMPASGWEQLEKELVSPVEKRILYPYRKWVATAAAVLLVAATSLSIYFLNTPTAEEIRRTATPMLAADPDILPQTDAPDVQVAKVEPARAIRPIVAQAKKIAERQGTEPSVPAEAVREIADGKETVQQIANEKEETEKEPVVTKEEAPVVRSHKRSGQDKLHIPVEKTESKKGRWSLGAAVGNAGGVSLTGNDLAGGGMPNEQRLNLVSNSAEGEIIRIPDNQMVVFKEGVPYLKRMDEIVDIKHHQPISFGLSVRKGLAKGFSVETGLTYTLLSSDVEMSGGNAMIDQKLHYIGIPVRANWNFFDKDRFTLYVAAGGMIEKCVYGKLGSEKQTVKPVQLSVAGAVGAQFNATKHVGIYVEPGVAYFFDDGSNVQTIRKETPCNFNIQAGIRFTY
ncbi:MULTISPECIES: outer membrane beta-barrel protein [unclassified Bacteroides]|uniref:outer membrane beta-barrel protein n=1 Tax=unclassified Bacteroides TaxID=2646097 RepID=UPI001C8C9374|nr:MULTISPECIES: outer membrane beta-barrel protein [unclassified Bacteroides]